MEDLIKEIVDDLEAELKITDVNYSRELLEVKVRNACKEVKTERRYPSTYDEEKILADLRRLYSNIRNIALYDYNQIGMEFQERHSESSVTIAVVDRNSLFNGVIPFSK